MNDPIVAFCGMTHLGINSAAAIADKGFKTVCFDLDQSLIEELDNGRLPVEEPDLADVLEEKQENILYSAKPEDLSGCHIAYISTDVPTNNAGESDLEGVLHLIETVIENLNDKAILVILCQVPPGFTRSLPFPGDRLFYQVETLIFGRAVERARFPERYIIGCSEPDRDFPENFNALLKAFDCPILPMRYESAELAKISINMCLVASVSVANTMAEICEQIGADWSEIVPSLRLDRRIGEYSYINPGLGIAGGNLERDLATVISLSEVHGTDGGVVSSWIANSHHRKNWAYRTLEAEVLNVLPEPDIAVWGLAYKENTHSIKNSPSIELLKRIEGKAITAYDPVVTADQCGLSLMQGSDPLDTVKGADVLLIMTPWPVFRSVSPQDIKNAMKGHKIIDPYRVLNSDDVVSTGLDYITLGAPPLRPK